MYFATGHVTELCLSCISLSTWHWWWVLIFSPDTHHLLSFGFGKDSLDETEEEDDVDFSHCEVEGGTTGIRNIDICLIQHLLHCEFLLQHLQVKCMCLYTAHYLWNTCCSNLPFFCDMYRWAYVGLCLNTDFPIAILGTDTEVVELCTKKFKDYVYYAHKAYCH